MPLGPRSDLLSKENEAAKNGSVLMESPKAVAELLRSAAHPARIHVLALLRQDDRGLSDLTKATGLSKNALVNHLSLLMSMRLVERVSRGEYRLTEDGKTLVDAASTVYGDSMRREQERREQMRRVYAKGIMEGEKMSKKVISKSVEYMPCWLSYTGAVAGSLRAMGIDCDVSDVGGRSGYSFIINVAKGVTCESGPTALHNETWDMIHHGTESLGVKMEHWFDDNSYPAKSGSPTPEELEKVRKLFERVKQEIDAKDRPVVLWGLVVPEYGIVKGYDGDSYVVSTYRSLTGKQETPIPFKDLQAPGCLDAYYFGEKTKQGPAADRQAVERAVKFASGSVPVNQRYVAGPEALEEWAKVLETAPEAEQHYFGNSYVGACCQESRGMSAAFLKRLGKKNKGKQSRHLMEAAKCYEKGTDLMTQFTKLFPFKMEGEMELEDRKKGAELLRKVKPLEEEAVKHMKAALKEWEASREG